MSARSETATAIGTCAVVECEKRTGPAGDYAKQEFPTCVQAAYDVKPSEHLDTPARSLSRGGLVTVLINVEMSDNGQFRGAAILNLAVTDATGVVHQIRSLGDLPMELHRPPPRTPKDLPVPVG